MKLIPKTIYLPSGGYSYPPVVLLKSLDMGYLFHQIDTSTTDSNFDFIQSIINHYCELPVNITKLYLCDLYYIYSYIQAVEINKKDVSTTYSICQHCNSENKISFFIGNFDITIYNKYKPITINNSFVNSTEDIKIMLNMRTVENNLELGNLLAAQESELEEIPYYEILAIMCLTQTESITLNGELVDKENWSSVILSLTLSDLFSLYNQAVNLNKTFGIYDKINYSCIKCGKPNVIWQHNDISESRFISRPSKNLSQVEGLVRYLVGQSRLPCFTIEDVYKRPFKLDEAYDFVLRDTKFQAGQVMF